MSRIFGAAVLCGLGAAGWLAFAPAASAAPTPTTSPQSTATAPSTPPLPVIGTPTPLPTLAPVGGAGGAIQVPAGHVTPARHPAELPIALLGAGGAALLGVSVVVARRR